MIRSKVTRRGVLLAIVGVLLLAPVPLAFISAGWPFRSEVGSLKLLGPSNLEFSRSEDVWYRRDSVPGGPWEVFRLGWAHPLYDVEIHRLGFLEIAFCTERK